MNRILKKILIAGVILVTAAAIVGGRVGSVILVNYVANKQYREFNTFDIEKDGLLMIAAYDNGSKETRSFCINKEMNKQMTIADFESDPFTAYKIESFFSERRFLDDDGNEIKNDEINSFFLQKAEELKYKFNLIVYETRNGYLFSYESDGHGFSSIFHLGFYNDEMKSISWIGRYTGSEVIKLKILSDLNQAF